MKRTIMIALILCTALFTTVVAFGAERQPVKELQQQIDQLKIQLQNIQLTPGPQGPAGLTGATGPEGPKGGEGPAGPADQSRTYKRYSLPVTTLKEQFSTATVTCNAGDRVLRGGPDTGAVDMVAERSFPDTDSSWTVTLKPTADSIQWLAVATCLETK
jgi:hypothetical protein